MIPVLGPFGDVLLWLLAVVVPLWLGFVILRAFGGMNIMRRLLSDDDPMAASPPSPAAKPKPAQRSAGPSPLPPPPPATDAEVDATSPAPARPRNKRPAPRA